MKKVLLRVVITSILTGLLISSCTKKDDNNPNNEGFVQISFSNSLKNSLKSANITDSVIGVSSIVITVEDASGKVVKNSEKIELYNMNGDYISKPISFITGGYKLTRFLVLDWKNNIVYASPVKGSPKAYLVQVPLPISFNIKQDEVVKLTPEILSTIESKPEDFGYVTFGFDVASTFDFLIGTFIFNETVKNYELTTANISILSGSATIYTGQLKPMQNDSLGIVSALDSIGITNKITLPERYNSYTLVISKPNYKIYSQTFTKDELKLHLRSVDKGPLVVILEKSIIPADGLIAYYPFNGNANDEGGNNLNGTAYGATPCANRLGTTNSAYSLRGNTDYIDVPNSSILKCQLPVTISVWVYFSDLSRASGIFTSDYLEDKYTGYWLGQTIHNGNAVIGIGYGDGGGDPNGIAAQYRRSKLGTTSLAINTWYYVTAVIKGPTDMDIYINGQKEVDGFYEGSGGTVKYSSNTGSIGRKDNSYQTVPASFYYMNGKVDELRVYNRVLTDQEISTLYQLNN